MWCDFGANLEQHFIGRYSRCSRYRTKSHDKATISHDITRYSRYQTVLLKLQEIIYSLIYKSSATAELFVFPIYIPPPPCYYKPSRDTRHSIQGRFLYAKNTIASILDATDSGIIGLRTATITQTYLCMAFR